MTNSSPANNTLYRYFSDRSHAVEFANGNVWLSTLEHIRKCDATRADIHDATMTYNVTKIDPNTDPKNADVILSRLANSNAIRISPESKGTITFQNITVHTTYPDSYVLCMTRKKSDSRMKRLFGDYCVEISAPDVLFSHLTYFLNQQIALRQSGFRPVTYGGRSFADIEDQPGFTGWSSTKDFQVEAEERMIWLPSVSITDKGRVVHAPIARTLCRVLS